MKNKEGGVCGRGDETQLTEIGGETLVPRPWSLLQTIQRVLQQTDMVRVSRVDEARGLLTVDDLLQASMKECILHVKLVYRPVA